MAGQSDPLRCVIVDDNPYFVAAATNLLERQGLKIVGTFNTSADAIRGIEALRPDVVMVDVDLGEESGIELAERVHRNISFRPPVVLMSAHDEQDYADFIETSPATGFLPKSSVSAGAIVEILGHRC
jgi:DNA-binding NarL/FixJ family response regulator